MVLRRWGAALVLAAPWSLPLQAAVLQLAPIPIEVEAPQSAAVLSLGNRASAEVALQVRVFRWTQEQYEDRLVPTQDVAISPPIAVVPAGQTLTVRVVRVAAQPVAAEETYRIWVDELPSAKSKPRKGQSLRILMRYSVPVYFEPADADAGEPKLAWQLTRSSKDKWTLTAVNRGQKRARISGLQLYTPDGDVAAMPTGSELSGYVLAGQRMRWTLKPPENFPVVSGDLYRLSYQTETESHRERLLLDAGR